MNQHGDVFVWVVRVLSAQPPLLEPWEPSQRWQREADQISGPLFFKGNFARLREHVRLLRLAPGCARTPFWMVAVRWKK